MTLLAGSPLFTNILNGLYKIALPSSYKLHTNSALRSLGYLLVDGIHPRWTIFALPIHDPGTEEEITCNILQEALQKDI